MLRFGVVPLLFWHFTVDAIYTALLLLRSGNTYYVVSGAIASGILLLPLGVSLVLYLRRGGFLPAAGQANGGRGIRRRAPPSLGRVAAAVLRSDRCRGRALGVMGGIAVRAPRLALRPDEGGRRPGRGRDRPRRAPSGWRELPAGQRRRPGVVAPRRVRGDGLRRRRGAPLRRSRRTRRDPGLLGGGRELRRRAGRAGRLPAARRAASSRRRGGWCASTSRRTRRSGRSSSTRAERASAPSSIRSRRTPPRAAARRGRVGAAPRGLGRVPPRLPGRAIRGARGREGEPSPVGSTRRSSSNRRRRGSERRGRA